MLILAVPLVMVSFGALVGILDWAHSAEMHQQLRLEMERTARVSSQMLAAPLWYVNLTAVSESLRVLLEHPYIEAVVARDVTGKSVVQCVRSTSGEAHCRQQGQQGQQGQSEDSVLANGQASHVRPVFFKQGDIRQRAGEIEIYFSESRVDNLINRRLRRDAIFFVVLVISLLVGIFFATRRAIVKLLERWRQARRSSHDESLVGQEREKLSEITNKLNIYEDACESMHRGFCVFDRDFRLTAFNQRYLEILDYSEGSVAVGMSLKALLRANAARGEYGSANIDAMIIDRLAIASSNQHYLRERERPDGVLLEVESSPMPDGGFVSIYTDITQHKALENQLCQLTLSDTTTGLGGKALFHDRLQQALALADRVGWRLAVFLFDIDGFEDLSKAYGQDVGDLILREFGDRLRGFIRKSDTVARFAGDQFAVIQQRIESPDNAALLAHRILGAASRIFEVDGQSLRISLAIGVTVYPDDDRVSHNILKNAQLALTAAKAEGPHRYRFFIPEVDRGVAQRRHLEDELFNALRENRFVLHYQPRIDLATGALVGAEALIRWLHPEKGLLPPEEFIELAADRGLLAPLAEWMLEEACRQRLEWQRELSSRDDCRADGWRVVVPLPLDQFEPGQLVARLRDLVAKTSLDQQLLEVQIRGDMLLQDRVDIAQELLALRQLGVKSRMEDFANGRSPLQFVRQLAIDGFRLDRQLVRDLDGDAKTVDAKTVDAKTVAVVRALIHVARELALRVSATDVDTPELLDQLREIGCHEAQGMAVSAPLTSEEFLVWVTR